MTESGSAPDSAYRADDEIDLRELVRALWETRVPVVIALLGFAGLFWMAVMVLGVRDGIVYTWETDVHFTFEGAEEGQYPNESPFSTSDLLSPVVVRRVYELNDLESFGLSRAEFSDALSIASYAPAREFIVERYRSRLERDGLSATEIASLEEEFSEALERASRGQAVLTLTLRDGVLPNRSVLSDEMARKVMLDIPRVWAHYMTEETGIFASEISLYSADIMDSAAFEWMDGLVSTDVLKSQFGLLGRNLDALATLDNSGAVRDPETGLSLSDLRARAQWLENFVLEDIRAASIGLGLSGTPAATARFFQNRVEELTRRRQLLETRAQRIEQAMRAYVSGQSPTPLAIAPAGGSDVDELRGATAIPQFGSDFLDRLVQLGSDTGDLEFRQELTLEGLDYTLEAADIQAEIDRLARSIELMRGDAARDGDSAEANFEELAAEMQQRVSDVSADLRDLFLATERINQRLNELRFGGQEAIYNIVQPPGEASTPALVLTRSNLQRFVLGAFLVVILSVMGVFLFNMLRERGGD